MKLYVCILLALCALAYGDPQDLDGLNSLQSLEDAHAAPIAVAEKENGVEHKRVARFCCGGGGYGGFPRFGGGGFPRFGGGGFPRFGGGGFPRFGGGGFPRFGGGGFPRGGYGGYPRGGFGGGSASASASASASSGGFGYGK